MIDLVNQSHFHFVKVVEVAKDFIIDLAINKAISIKKIIIISFFELFL